MDNESSLDILKDTLNNALRMITQAKEFYILNHDDDFDVDWVMDKFGHAETILEEIRDIKDGVGND